MRQSIMLVWQKLLQLEWIMFAPKHMPPLWKSALTWMSQVFLSFDYCIKSGKTSEFERLHEISPTLADWEGDAIYIPFSTHHSFLNWKKGSAWAQLASHLIYRHSGASSLSSVRLTHFPRWRTWEYACTDIYCAVGHVKTLTVRMAPAFTFFLSLPTWGRHCWIRAPGR